MVSSDYEDDDATKRLSNTRRKALKGLGAAGIGLIAGCSGDGGDGGNGGDGDDGSDGSDGADDSGDGGTDFPSQDLRAIIPFGTGGGFDFYVRTLAQFLPNHLPNDVEVVAENVTGATGRVAANEMYSSDDPHTFILLHGDAFARAQAFEGTDFDLTEMTYYPQVAVGRNSIFLGNHVDIDTWEGYAEGLKNGDITFVTTGAADDPLGTGPFVNIQIGDITGAWTIDEVMDSPRLSYEGQGAAFTAIQQEEGDCRVTSFSSGWQYVQQDMANTFLHLDTEAPEAAPDARTLSDVDVEEPQRVADATASPFRIFAGPPGIDEEKAEIMRQAITDTIQSDEFQDAAAEADRPIVYEDSERAKETINTLIDTYEQQTDLFEPYIQY